MKRETRRMLLVMFLCIVLLPLAVRIILPAWNNTSGLGDNSDSRRHEPNAAKAAEE